MVESNDDCATHKPNHKHAHTRTHTHTHAHTHTHTHTHTHIHTHTHTHTDTYLGVTRYGASVPCIVGAYMLWCPVVWVQVVYP
jgi:hypothetical protein